MRSSKSRSRSKSNRNRAVGNIVNRVFDSSGPEGKVRGTPQQIIDKYTQLARDAQLGNDRVAFENFQQHAEHYTRMLAEAQREQEARREQQDQQNRDRQQARNERDDDTSPGDGGRHEQPRFDGREADGSRDDRRQSEPSTSDDVVDVGGESDSGLVETPESRPSKPRRRSRKSAPSDDGEAGRDSGDAKEAAE